MTRPASSSHRGRRARRGFTLIELIIYCAILGYVTYAVYEVFRGTQKYFAQADASVMVQQSAYATMKRILVEMSESKASLVVTSTSPTSGVIFPSPRLDGSNTRSYDGSQRPNFQQWVCIYLDTSTSTFCRKTIAIATPTNTPTLGAGYNTPALFAAYSGSGVGPPKRIGGYAQALAVTASTDPPGFSVTVSCLRNAFGRDYGYTVQNFVSTHNN